MMDKLGIESNRMYQHEQIKSLAILKETCSQLVFFSFINSISIRMTTNVNQDPQFNKLKYIFFIIKMKNSFKQFLFQVHLF